jgi:coproporphyrinogen III oxidase
MLTKEEITDWFKSLQDSICKALEEEDGKGKFLEDNWLRTEGGGGRTRIIQHGNVIEKGGVLFSAVHGPVPEFLTKETPLSQKNDNTFYATGVSIVIHPSNPMVPIIHMNVRYFEMSNGVWWFGGGIDLTPHYVVEEDAHFFHSALKESCDKHDKEYYPKFKKWADDYFFIPHRNETRGIGGIFFDKLTENQSVNKQQLFDFVKEVGNTFAPAYTSLMKKNKLKSFTPENKQWQLLRRGRYVEFNLVYDKGTKFGLETNGRTESILMSLPETAGWQYNYIPKKGSPEEFTLSHLKKGIERLNS